MLRFQRNRFLHCRDISASYPSFVQGPHLTNRYNVSYCPNFLHQGLRANSCGLGAKISEFANGKHFKNRRSKAPGEALSVRCSLSKAKASHKKLLRIAVMVSGGGRSLQNICEQIHTGQMKGCQVCLVIASKPSAGALTRAQHFGIPTRTVRQRDFDGNTDHFSKAISHLFDEFKIDLVVMAGWMHFYQIPPRYSGKVINIHPSLIPSFCGKGYYGGRVHDAVVSHLVYTLPKS
eukprot:gb/GEZJ01004842.1/.p1 GENE.gb/GEZJ01004842.1/~~gb/GEZJ01004842.1/.p1  ORF type:complete len:234 (+),score=18.85 gb/GEZJ01004842.1/:418-1119(+)